MSMILKRSTVAPVASSLYRITAVQHLTRPTKVVHGFAPAQQYRSLQSSTVSKPSSSKQSTQDVAGEWSSRGEVKYDEIKSLSESSSDDVIVIDVRESDETSLGAIPNSHFLPLSHLPQALSLPAPQFQELYNFEKPSKSAKIIVYCRSGRRSGKALEMMTDSGEHKGAVQGKGFEPWTDVRNYSGSWLDWEARNPK